MEGQDLHSDEDSGHGALIIDVRDLDTVMSVTSDNSDDNTDDGLKDNTDMQGSNAVAAIGRANIDVEDDSEEDDERIRQATNKYLEGSCTLADFTAELEKCVDDQRDDALTQPTTQEKPGIALDDEPSLKRSKQSEEVPTVSERHVEQPSNVPSSSQESRSMPFVNFYSTGDAVSSFTLRRKKKISPTVQGLIGEAHLRYVRGELQAAISICQEIIKEQPTLTDPYALLSLIYYDMEEFDRSLRFGMIGAMLDPKHCKEWPRLAEMSLEQNNVQQAIACYNHAINSSPDVSENYFRRCELLQSVGDTKGAIRCYQRLIQDESSLILQIAALPKEGKLCVLAYRKIAQLYYAEKDREKAYIVLQQAFTDYPAHVTNIEANLILELMRKFKKYVESVRLLQKHCKVAFDPPLRDIDFKSRPVLTRALARRKNVTLPPHFPIELTVRVMTALIHLEAYPLVEIVLPLLLQKDIDKFGDLYLEVAEAYMAKQKWLLALKVTSLIIESPNMKEASLCFLRHAETLYSLRMYEEAAKAYETVISLVPNHHVAKLNYALILQKLGRADDALQTLSQDEKEKAIDHHMILEKCKIFIQQHRFLELFDSAKFLFSRHCHIIRSKEDAGALASCTKWDRRYEVVQVYRFRRNEATDDKRPKFMNRPELIETEWQIYLHICRICFRMERYDLLQRFAYTAWSSEVFGRNRKMELACGYHAYYATLLNMDMDLLAPFVKFQSLKDEGITTTMQLNLFSKALQRQEYVRYGRHLSRLAKRFPENDRIKLIVAHHNFSCGNYKSAVNQYFYLYSKDPKDPFVSLMIVSCLLSILSQKTTTNRSQLGIHIIAFLQNYMANRGKCQEMYYNVGRTLHILGIFQESIHYYQKALELPPVDDKSPHEVILPESDIFTWPRNPLDLRRDILYNLVHLYRSTGSPLQARYYLNQIRV